MMITPSQHDIHCIGCEYSCQIYPDAVLRSQYCGQSSFAIWPEGNLFLQQGILTKLRKENNRLSCGFIFVDFSLPWLRDFIDAKWIDNLIKTGMRIVIITDNHLRPLANYWITRSNKIHGILYASDDDDIQRMKIRRLFTGRLALDRQGRMLNYSEVMLLNRFMSGICAQGIISIDKIETKKVYVHKYRLEKKLGFTVQQLISRVL
ncbi:helix-turn-helix transcriptional regulator [Scandinavium sp. NPDC088450]|uniref:helix-turn-helix transcriptional regulator n=1 Tax=Scandinavium sp. NPDC088450 TaxID=3364514 RepID=UPI00384E6D6A